MLLTSLGIVLRPDLHAWLCIGSLKKFNQRYPIKNDATLLVVNRAGIARSPMGHEGWGLGVTITMPRRVLGGHRYRWDLSEIHASPWGLESSTSTRSENSDSLSGVIPFWNFFIWKTLSLSRLKEIQESQDSAASRWIALEIKKKSPWKEQVRNLQAGILSLGLLQVAPVVVGLTSIAIWG